LGVVDLVKGVATLAKTERDDLLAALQHADAGVRHAAVQHPNFPPEALPQALQHADADVRWHAVLHPNFPPEALPQALQDADTNVRSCAVEQQQKQDPDSVTGQERLEGVRLGTHKLRKLRDMLVERGGAVSKRQFPNFPANLSPLLDSQGNLRAEAVQAHIDAQPQLGPFNVSHSKWTGGQRHTSAPSNVLQLNLSNAHVQALRAAGVYPTFARLSADSLNSGHPVTPTTLGWVRYTGTPKTGFHIDEIQSDLGQHLGKQARAQARAQGVDEEEAGQRAETRWPQAHLDKISQVVFGGRHPSEVLHEAFRQYWRQKGHVNTPIAIHAATTKAPLSGQDPSRPLPAHMQLTYDQLPQKAGFEPGEYGQLKTQSGNLKGQPTWNEKVRKAEAPPV
jgi:hypothetical protein